MQSLDPGRRARVRVPATSANLGPGFDALGLCLAWYDDVWVEVRPAGLSFDVSGEGEPAAPRDESHLIVSTLRATLAELGAHAPGLHLRSTNRIPHGRGLGSSAAAICAGVLLARALVPGAGARLDLDGVLALASRIEGHPDNVAACVLGGLTIAWTQPGPNSDSVARAITVAPAPQVRPVIFVPPFQSSTEQARRLLPAHVPHADAAFNGGRAALLVAALTQRSDLMTQRSDLMTQRSDLMTQRSDLMTQRSDLLLAATEDRLHQPYRAPAMSASAELLARLRAEGLAAVISGAGPTVLALVAAPEAEAAALALAPAGWLARSVAVDHVGAQVIETPSS